MGARKGTLTRMVETRAAARWWETLYDEWIAEALLVRADPDEVARTLDFLEGALRLEAGARVFDQCCGIGSLAVPLAERGYDVIGVDQAASYIARAQESAQKRPRASSRFETADAFEYVARPACEAAFNWWTSYGYANSTEENATMLRRAFESLVPGGRFALDVPNLPGLLRSFEHDRTDERDTPRGRVTMRRKSEIDLKGGRLVKHWAFDADGERRSSCTTSLQLALPSDHIAALESVGFRTVETFGQIDGRALDLDAPRCILIAERPG